MSKLAVKVIAMVMALGCVLYGIKALKSSTEQSQPSDNAIALLLGSDARPMNWCPAGVTEIEIYSNEGALLKTLKSAPELSASCEILIGSTTQDTLKTAAFKKRMVAKNPSGAAKVLEQAENTLFRVQGFPFTSPMLAKILTRQVGH